MTHALVPLCAGLAAGRTRVSAPLMITGMALAMLPDADVIGFKFGIDYADQFGHRGASHALVVAAVVAGFLTALWRPENWKITFSFLFFSMASHGLLDTLTNGGLGSALYWPFDNVRIFAPFTPIKVSPIGYGFFSERGLTVMLSEIRWVWAPAIALLITTRFLTRINARAR